jgi:plasmid stabilization system protein ParE
VIVSLSPRALADLDEIRAYLVPRSPQGAESVRRAIADTLDLMAQFPRAGRETDIAGVRVIPVVRYRYLVYHAVLTDEVVILHIRHSSRDAPSTTDLR